MQLQDRIAIVTGGANGIGRAIVNRLGREGASVVVADIDAKQARKVVAEANGLGYTGDVYEGGCDQDGGGQKGWPGMSLKNSKE